MRIRFLTTESDWAALADFQLVHSQTLKRAVRVTSWIAVGVVLVMTLLIWLVTRCTLLVTVTVLAGGFATMGVPRTIRFNMRKQLRSMFRESFPAGTNTETSLEIRPDGLATESHRGSGLLAWSAFTTLDESEEHIFLGMGGATGIVIPTTRVVEGDIAAFRSGLRTYILPATRSITE